MDSKNMDNGVCSYKLYALTEIYFSKFVTHSFTIARHCYFNLGRDESF